MALSRKEIEKRAIAKEKKIAKGKRKPLKIKKSELHPRKVLININSSDGDTFNLLALAKKWSIQLQLNYNLIYEEMTASDRDHLLEVFKKHFGTFVTLYE